MDHGQGTRTINRISSQAVEAATGRGWDAWLAALDAAGGTAHDHKWLVAHLERAHPEVPSGWWRQSIAVAYEQARGLRVVGQTADAGFQLGVQRTLEARPDTVWDVLVTEPGLWLGAGAAARFEVGARYEAPGDDTSPAASGEIRVVKPGHRLRMTWQPAEWTAPARLQLTVSPASSGRTRLQVHLERLPDAAAREDLRERWRETLERIAARLEHTTDPETRSQDARPA